MSRAGTILAIASVAVAAAMATPIALARSKPPVEAPAPPPPPPPAGPISLPARTLADAAAFQAWLERVQGISPAFVDGPSVARGLKDATAYEPHALVRDAVAYGAIAALQDPTFVAAVRAAGDSPDNRRLMVGYLIADARYALLFKGSDRAAGLAQQAIGSAGLTLFGQGKVIKQASYDIQHQAWSKQDVAGRPDRLRMVETQGEQPLPDAADHVPALQREAVGAQAMGISAPAIAPPYPALVAEALQLAAIAALGEAGDDLYDRLAALPGDQYGADTCLHDAKLNLYQCLAVAKPNYEDIYCMGQHGVSDTGACLVKAAGLALPPEPLPPPPPPRPAARSTAQSVRSAARPAAQPVARAAARPVAIPTASAAVTPAAPPASGPISNPIANLRANLVAGRIANPVDDMTTNPINNPTAYPPTTPTENPAQSPPANTEIVPTAPPGAAG